MIVNYKYGISHNRDLEVINYIKDVKSTNKNYKVIDIGASLNAWTDSITDATIDIIENPNKNKLHFLGNLNYFEVWKNVLDYVNENGKFDFSICTHTLEDISNPKLVADMISKISNSGFISFPSKYYECNRHNRSFTGWLHHRWIFNYEKEKIIAYPKLPFIEYLDYLKFDMSEYNTLEELSFFWQDSTNIEIINDDYFPSEDFMLNTYRNILN
jgi:hypothetical protein